MSESKKQTINLTEHIGSVVFEKKENAVSNEKISTLEEEMVCRNNMIFKIQAQSVVLPPNYKPQVKTENQVLDWLRNKIHSRHSATYVLSLKYEEKTKIKLEQKEPYNNN